MHSAIEVVDLHRSFAGKAALQGVSLRVEAGEMVALLGASGSGKSTLLRHLSGLQRADADTVSSIRLLGRVLQEGGRLGHDVRAIRAEVASIFQQFNLVGRLPVMDNVLAGAAHRLPLWRCLTRLFPAAELARAREALAGVGMETLAWRRASTLSGGQQQRAAISRAVVQGARIILADEPIASLDPESSRRVMELLGHLNRSAGVTVLVSLHQVEAARAHCPRTIAMRAGRIVADGPTASFTPARLREIYGSASEELLAGAPAERAEAAHDFTAPPPQWLAA